MQALRHHSYGNPVDVVVCDDILESSLESHHVRLRMIYAPINPADINMCEGKYLVKPSFPCSLGNEGVGEVTHLGEDVEGVSVGDRVIYPFQSADEWIGFWRESVDVPYQGCIKVPDRVSSQQASMLSINPITAFLMLNQFVQLKPGDWIIQNLATSGVGYWVQLLAKQLGLRTIHVVRSEDQVDRLTRLGADRVIVAHDRFSSHIKEKGRCRLALNGVGGDSAKEIAKCLEPHGVMVTYGAMAKQPIQLGNALLIYQNIQCTGFNRSRWVDETPMDVVKQAYQNLFDRVSSMSSIDVPIDEVYALSDFKKALTHAQKEDRKGKILFRF